MHRNTNSRLLTGFLLILITTCASAQYYEVDVPEGYSMAPPQYLEGLPSISADSSWVENDYVTSGYQTYTIQKGDTLGSISKKFFGTTQKWKKIASINGIDSPSKIKIGQVLEIPTIEHALSQGVTYRQRTRYISSPPTTAPAPVTTYSSSVISLPLPPVTQSSDSVIYSGMGLPQIILPGDYAKKDKSEGNHVAFNGLTGLINTFSAYSLGENIFSVAFGTAWNKISKREGERLYDGEDADYYELPVLLTYAGENFEVALKMPFESYDVYAPKTYNFRDGSDSGMGNTELRLKFTTQNDEMASCLGLGTIFSTSDIQIGNTEDSNAWEVFAGLSTKRKEGGNIHINGGYQASDGNKNYDGIFVNVGFDYAANESFTFMGEVNYYDGDNAGRSTDLTLGARYHVKPGMSITVAAPIALSNDMFFGYDYRLQALLQCHY